MPPALARLLTRLNTFTSSQSNIHAFEQQPIFCFLRHHCANLRHYTKKDQSIPDFRWQSSQERAEQNFDQDGMLKVTDSESKGLTKLEIAYDARYWVITLAQQERLKRLQGVRKIWAACRYRNFDLPTDDTPDAEFLWRTFIKNPNLVDEVINHALELLQKKGETYGRLYEVTIRYWLPRDPRLTLKFHHQMLVKLRLRKLPLKLLARVGSIVMKPPAYEALIQMYRTSNERDIYDEVVPVLIEKGDSAMARRWHALCMARDDLPSESSKSHPVVQVLLAENSAISKPNQGIAKFNQELTNRLLGRDAAPVRFDDSFVARMFATRAISPTSIIQGLAMVGVNEIGPQAVLAIAARTHFIEELPIIFEELRKVGIALRGSVFSLALEKFAMEQKWPLVRSMLESDQHPDVFGDSKTQQNLLKYYLTQGDHMQAQRTLAILTLFHNQASAASWNLLLQMNIEQSGHKEVMRLLQDLRSHNIPLSTKSLKTIKGLLRGRNRGHRPVALGRGNLDDLRFVTRVFVFILESGMAPIYPLAWREIIRRFGILGRFRELKRLLLWLLCWYVPRGGSQFATLAQSPFQEAALARLRSLYPLSTHYFNFPSEVLQHKDPSHPIRQIFTPSLQQALIVWGFRASLVPSAHLEQSILGPMLAKKHHRSRLIKNNMLYHLDWSIGLRFLVQLRQIGVHVHRHTVAKALQMQFLVMFGPGRSGKVGNRIMARTNELSYASYIKEVNEIWGSPLFSEPQFSRERLHQEMWHPHICRRTERKMSLRLQEVLGPDCLRHDAAQEDGTVYNT